MQTSMIIVFFFFRVTLMLRNLGLQAVPLHGQMTQVSKTVPVTTNNKNIKCTYFKLRVYKL